MRWWRSCKNLELCSSRTDCCHVGASQIPSSSSSLPACMNLTILTEILMQSKKMRYFLEKLCIGFCRMSYFVKCWSPFSSVSSSSSPPVVFWKQQLGNAWSCNLECGMVVAVWRRSNNQTWGKLRNSTGEGSSWSSNEEAFGWLPSQNGLGYWSWTEDAMWEGNRKLIELL